MPNGHGNKEYGGHKYGENGRGNCEHGCGCWMGSAQSNGPTGIDPFGTCPKNPKDGKLLGGNADYEHVVNERIRNLEQRAYAAEQQLEKVKPSKTKLAEELASAKKELVEKENLLAKLRHLLGVREV